MSLDIWLEQYVDYGGPDGPEKIVLMDENMTHNLTAMWELVGVYTALYHSEGKEAREVYDALTLGVEYMKRYPSLCKKHDAPNGWGTYEQALPWLEKVTEAFRRYPKATIRVSR